MHVYIEIRENEYAIKVHGYPNRVKHNKGNSSVALGGVK